MAQALALEYITVYNRIDYNGNQMGAPHVYDYINERESQQRRQSCFILSFADIGSSSDGPPAEGKRGPRRSALQAERTPMTVRMKQPCSVGGLALVGEVFRRFGLGSGLAFREDGRWSDRVPDGDVAAMMMDCRLRVVMTLRTSSCSAMIRCSRPHWICRPCCRPHRCANVSTILPKILRR